MGAVAMGSPRPDTTKLIESHRSYAHAVASEVIRKMPHTLDKEDLLGAAELGLVEAANAFDASRGVLFKTFAYYRIRGAVYDCLRKMGWFSKAQYEQYRFEVAANEYMKDYSAAPPPNGSPAEDLHELSNVTGTITSCYLLSLDSLTHEVAGDPGQSPEAQAGGNEEKQRLRQALTQLPEKNRQILQAYYFEDKTLDEIGASLGLSKSWVCRIHAKSLEMVRDILNGRPDRQETLAGPAR
ncbi:MAG: sigma-70 family RNA polymerase sigma factor [Bryobacteraceae bacterium]